MKLTTAARFAKHGLAYAADRSGALDLARRALRAYGPRVHIFGYHRVVTDLASATRACIGPLCVSSRAFDEHLDHVARSYEVWRLDDALDLLEGLRRPPARDVAVLTFDDGYRDVLDNAAPALAARRMPATVYVTVAGLNGKPLLHDRLYLILRRVREARMRLLAADWPDRLVWPISRADFALQHGDPTRATDAILDAACNSDADLICAVLAARVGEPDPGELTPMLGWSDLDRLVDSGLEIGAHGVSHTQLPLENDEVLADELSGTRAALARHTGVPPTTFSYPAGRYDARVLVAARQAGYRAAVTTEDRRNRPGDDLLRLGRKVLSEEHGVGAGGRHVPELVAAQLDGLFTAVGLSHAVPGDRCQESPWT